MKTHVWLLLLACCVLWGCPSQQTKRGQVTSQSKPLLTGLPVWHTMTSFERQVVTAARRETPHTLTLLRLALLFSGPRTDRAAAPLLQKYKRFVAMHKPKLMKVTDTNLRGKRLLALFHTQMLGSQTNPETTRYQLHQTRIDVLLQRGSFNCLSSSIVFGLLATEMGFDARIALMPTHAFVEVKGNGGWLPVETTSPRGFAPKFDQAYYNNQNKSWAVARGLRPATYAEYKARELRSVRHVICRMALWTHLTNTWPNTQDQRRLREIAGAIDQHFKIQGNRMATWINTYQGYHKTKRYQRANGLFRVIGPTLAQLANQRRWPLRLKRFVALLHVYWFETTWRQNDKARLTRLYKSLQQQLGTLGKQQGPAAGHLKWLLSHILDTLADKGDESQGKEWLNRAKQLSPQHTPYYESLFWNHLGNHYLKQQSWQRAMSAYRTCLSRTAAQPDPTCQRNLKVAIHNWGIVIQKEATRHTQAGRFQQGVDAFRRCIKRMPPSHPVTKACQHGLAATYYNWSVRLLRANDKATARQKLAACLQLPRPLPQCHHVFKQLK